jgi:hypothetical protein
MIKLKDLLAENMRRFKTKNLNEDNTIFQKASPNENSNWKEVFRDMKPTDITVNELFGWWLEVYSAIADKLLYYSEQLDRGNKITQYSNDILEMIGATKTCIDKISMLHPEVYAKMRKDESILLNDIKDDLIEELRELLKNPQMYESNDIAEKLSNISNDYQRISNSLLELSWDYTDDEDESGYNPTDFNNKPVDNNIFNYHIKQTQSETPWISTNIEDWDERNAELINKLNQGKTLYEIYSWLMNTQPYEEGRFATNAMDSAYYDPFYFANKTPLIPFDAIMAFKKAIAKDKKYKY